MTQKNRGSLLLASTVLLIASMVVFSGCMKTYEYLKTEVPQGKEQLVERQTLSGSLASQAVYDEFETKAIFDVLWLSNFVREKNARIIARMQGKDEAALRGLIRRALAQNTESVSFYILADIRDGEKSLLVDENPAWSLVLESKEGGSIEPQSIASVELQTSWQSLFGPACNRYKKAYLVSFPLKDIRGVLVRPEQEPFTLSIRSVDRHVQFSFGYRISGNQSATGTCEQGAFVEDEDFYWV